MGKGFSPMLFVLKRDHLLGLYHKKIELELKIEEWKIKIEQSKKNIEQYRIDIKNCRLEAEEERRQKEEARRQMEEARRRKEEALERIKKAKAKIEQAEAKVEQAEVKAGQAGARADKARRKLIAVRATIAKLIREQRYDEKNDPSSPAVGGLFSINAEPESTPAPEAGAAAVDSAELMSQETACNR